MAFQWVDSLKLAERLAVENDEAAQRSAISRAYYYVFHLARDRATENGMFITLADSQHKLTWEFFVQSPDVECQKLGLLGQRLKEKRKKADYDLIYAGKIEQEVTDVIAKAQAFAERLQTVDRRMPNSQSQRRTYR